MREDFESSPIKPPKRRHLETEFLFGTWLEKQYLSVADLLEVRPDETEDSGRLFQWFALQ